jgi:hypothetical protein
MAVFQLVRTVLGDRSFVPFLLIGYLLGPSVLCNCTIFLNAIAWNTRPWSEWWTWQWVVVPLVLISPFIYWTILPISYRHKAMRVIAGVFALISLVPTYAFMFSSVYEIVRGPRP